MENILLKDIKMLEPVINSSYCLTISWRTFMYALKYIYVLMDFYYFAFVHYILITIRRPHGTETLNKKKGYDQARPGEYGHKQKP